MALSHVTVYPQNIRTHFQARPFGGTSVGTGRGLSRSDANAIAARMVLQARINAADRFDQRTTALVTSVVPIVRQGPGGQTEVGVGTRVEHGMWLEIGTDMHYIAPRNKPFLQHNPNSPRAPLREEWVLGKRHYRPIPHPGNRAYHWLSDAVRTVIPGAPVRVRTPRGRGPF